MWSCFECLSKPSMNPLSALRNREFWVLVVLYWYYDHKRNSPPYTHLPGYTYDNLTEDKYEVTVTAETHEDKPNCPIIPQFNIKDWRAFRQQARLEPFFPEDEGGDEDVGVMKFRQQLIEKGFPHQSSWTPSSCNPVHNVTLIVPYRNRFDQLKKFIIHMHPFLKLQQVSYRIVIVEHMNGIFNKGKLFNIGFVESQRRFPSHCYILHDVDMLPENLENIYGCTKSPRHMSAAANSWRYLLSYKRVFGGAVSMTGEQFKQVNGFSNSYYGWGGEDDDFHDRVIAHNMNVTRFNPVISSYLMTPHTKEVSGNNEKLRETGAARFDFDGLNDLNYTLDSFEDGVGFTYIQAIV